MTHRIFLYSLLLFSSNAFSKGDTLSYGMFGKIVLFKSTTQPQSLLLFVSGDGGWNKKMTEIVTEFRKSDMMIAGIDVRNVMRNINASKKACSYPAGDFENLSKFIQKKYHFADYKIPLLIGYSSGATIVYALLAQAPANTFKGAIALGFCPDLEVNKPLCKGDGLVMIKRNEKLYDCQPASLSAPFIAMQAKEDKICNYGATLDFINQCKNASSVSLAKVGHAYSDYKHWMPQFNTSIDKLLEPPLTKNPLPQFTNADAQKLNDLPLNIYPASKNDTLPMVLFISGDGGWTSFDESLAETFAMHNMPVAGLNSLKYFWDKKSPQQAAADVEKILRAFMQHWHRQSFILAGYSFGADAMPFIESHIGTEMKTYLRMTALLSPSDKADFEIHISDMLFNNNSDDVYDVPAEVQKLNLPVVIFFGSDEAADTKSLYAHSKATIVTLSGGHHYQNQFETIVDKVTGVIR